jgi:hypothetical protein
VCVCVWERDQGPVNNQHSCCSTWDLSMGKIANVEESQGIWVFCQILYTVFENEENLFTPIVGSEILVKGTGYAICKCQLIMSSLLCHFYSKLLNCGAYWHFSYNGFCSSWTYSVGCQVEWDRFFIPVTRDVSLEARLWGSFILCHLSPVQGGKKKSHQSKMD